MNTFDKPRVCGCNDPNIRIQDELDEFYATLQNMQGRVLPEVSSQDDGKFLRVVKGAWAASEVPCAEDTKF